MKSKSSYDVIIIGAGPGGISAAIYLKRAGINPLVLEADAPGGTLNKTHKIENYPGYVDKDGTTLAFRMYSQIEELGVTFKTEKVINIENENNFHKVITENNVYECKYIIIATGKIPRKLDIKDADKYNGKGVSYCTICDGTLYKGKTIAIVGGGNSAMESASYMKDIAKKIYIINRSPVLRADEKEQKEGLITGIKLDNEKQLEVSAIFVCIGQESNLAYYQNLNLKTDNLGIIVDVNMKTSDDYVYACGDAISKSLYQVVTAVSEGAIAATNIIKNIKKKSN